MNEKLGWGIIGTGGIAELQVKDLITAGLHVAAVGSRTQTTAEAFGDRFEIPKRHGSYADLVRDSTVDTVTARATLTELGVDELTAIIFEYESGAQASMHTGFLTPGPNVASVIGSEGRIEIDAVWYTQTSFTRHDQAGRVVERYSEGIEGRGMQYQALEVERCIREGLTTSPVMPISESIEIMATMDEIRRQIGVEYSSSGG